MDSNFQEHWDFIWANFTVHNGSKYFMIPGKVRHLLSMCKYKIIFSMFWSEETGRKSEQQQTNFFREKTQRKAKTSTKEDNEISAEYNLMVVLMLLFSSRQGWQKSTTQRRSFVLALQKSRSHSQCYLSRKRTGQQKTKTKSTQTLNKTLLLVSSSWDCGDNCGRHFSWFPLSERRNLTNVSLGFLRKRGTRPQYKRV